MNVNMHEVAHTLSGRIAVSTAYGKAGGEPIQEDKSTGASHVARCIVILFLFFSCFWSGCAMW